MVYSQCPLLPPVLPEGSSSFSWKTNAESYQVDCAHERHIQGSFAWEWLVSTARVDEQRYSDHIVMTLLEVCQGCSQLKEVEWKLTYSHVGIEWTA